MDVQVLEADDFTIEDDGTVHEMLDVDGEREDLASAGRPTADELLERLVGARDAALRNEALISLTHLVVDTYGPDAERLAEQIRASGGIEAMVACLGGAAEEAGIQQCAMECLGTLCTTTFEPHAHLSLRHFVTAGGLPLLQALCDAPDPRAPGPNVIFAVAMLQNVTAADDADDDDQHACASLRASGCEAVLERLIEAASLATDSVAASLGAGSLIEYAAGALSNLRARDPSPPELQRSNSVAVDEALRQRRLRHAVDAMRARRAVHTVQNHARVWLTAKREAKAERGAIRAMAEEEAREAAEVAALEASLAAEAEAAKAAAAAEALAAAARVEELKLAEAEAARMARIWASLEAMMAKSAEAKIYSCLRRWSQRWRARRAEEEMAAAQAEAAAAEEASDLLSAVGLEEFRLGRLARLSHELSMGPGGNQSPLSWTKALVKAGAAPRNDRILIHLEPLPAEMYSFTACEAAAAKAASEQDEEMLALDGPPKRDSPPSKLRVRHNVLSRDRIRLSRSLAEARSSSEDLHYNPLYTPELRSPDSPPPGAMPPGASPPGASPRGGTPEARSSPRALTRARFPERARHGDKGATRGDAGGGGGGGGDGVGGGGGGGGGNVTSGKPLAPITSTPRPGSLGSRGGSLEGMLSPSSSRPSTRDGVRSHGGSRPASRHASRSPPRLPRSPRSSRAEDDSPLPSPGATQCSGTGASSSRPPRPSTNKKRQAAPTAASALPSRIPPLPPVTGTQLTIVRGKPPPPSVLHPAPLAADAATDSAASSSPASPVPPTQPAPSSDGQAAATSPRAAKQKQKAAAANAAATKSAYRAMAKAEGADAARHIDGALKSIEKILKRAARMHAAPRQV